MKSYEQVHEILGDVGFIHHQMSDFFRQLHKKDEDERLKMLLDYLVQHENHRENTLAKYERETSSKAVKGWFKYMPENNISTHLKKLKRHSSMSVNDVLQIALELDDRLITIYKRLVECAKDTEVKNLFDYLLKRLEKEKRNLARDSLWLYDY